MTDIHFLLTYTCNFECDHCFLYCGPKSEGTFTIKQIKEVLNEAAKIGTQVIYFEGGEPFLYYPVMVEGLKIAHKMGFKTGIVTNCYWATSIEDAELWLEPIAKTGISILSVSDDSYHFGTESVFSEKKNPAERAIIAARNLGIQDLPLCIKEPTPEEVINKEQDIMFKGRAAEKLIDGMPKRHWEDLTKCPYENLKNPTRVHVDSFGNVHICQGLSIGNMWETPLAELIKNYDVEKHPICGHLFQGGPAQLAKVYNMEHEDKYVDECHFCYLMRLALIDKFSKYLTPRQVYGL